MGINTINLQTLPTTTSTTPLTTVTPSVAIASQLFGEITFTVTKSGGGEYTNPNYSAFSVLANDTVTVSDANVDRFLESDSSHLAGTLKVSDTNASGDERTFKVKAQEFEDSTQSAFGTVNYTPVFIKKRYIRIRGVDSDGADSASRLGIADISFYDAAANGGTRYPTEDLTAVDSEDGIAVSAGHSINSTYDPWKAADSNLTNTFWWALGTTAANNYWEIEFEPGTYGGDDLPTIKSININFNPTGNDAGYFKITGSDAADHDPHVNFGVVEITSEGTVLVFG
jgi:hypothetical protein